MGEIIGSIVSYNSQKKANRAAADAAQKQEYLSKTAAVTATEAAQTINETAESSRAATQQSAKRKMSVESTVNRRQTGEGRQTLN